MRYITVQQTKEEHDISICYGCCLYNPNHLLSRCKQPENIILEKGKFCYDITNGIYKTIHTKLPNKIKVL